MTWQRAASIAILVGSGLLMLTAAWPQVSPTPAPAPVPLRFDDALDRAATDLFSKANLPPGSDRIELVIDPLIDGVSAAQSVATHAMEKRIVELVRHSYPRFGIAPFSGEVLARAPVVLVGTFTAVNNAGMADAPRDAYRICLALADLRTKSILSKGVARAKPDGIDVSPTPAFADSPVWSADAATESYIKTCQGTKPGDPINPLYAERIRTAALVSDGIVEYDAKRYREALAFYRIALRMPGGDQLRVRNGIYLTNWRLNRREDATDSFGNVVDYSLNTKKLSVRFLFRPGSTQFLEDQQITAPYSMWLSQIASHAVERDVCLEIVGHTSPTGPASVNERLSFLRAQFIKDLLQSSDHRLLDRLTAIGVGPREVLIGTGRDDASDAIDRRVDFKVRKC